MADSMEGVVKARKSCDNVASNGGLDSTYMIPNEQSVFHNETQRQIIANREDRESLVLWKRPIVTLQYFIKELCIDLYEFGINILMYYKLVILFILVLAVCILTYHAEGPHQKYVALLEKKFFWCAYWVGLGVLSSVGLGTGLHTFVLYLGPHIASVTLAAYECNSLNFPEPPYPDEIICPEEESGSGVVSILKIMSKVRLEAFMWGAGTALGELPPYFMAKAARLSGQDNDDEELKEFTELLQQRKNRPEEQSFIDGAKLTVQKLVEKVGFFGILACASMTVRQIINFTVSVFVLCLIQIPNPLFDLAGITCGHFLVPFWTFFGATLLGKAIIKTHIQKLFVIVAFNENQVHTLVEKTKYVPYIGKYLHAPLHDFLLKQKEKLHRKVGSPGQSEGSWLSWMYQKFVIAMVAYFVISIVNSIAQSHHKRLTKNQNRARSKLATD